MKCEKCCTDIPDGSAFCPLCGEIVSQPAPQTVPSEPEQPFFMPLAEDRPGLTEKPPKQELPIAKKNQNKALFVFSGILLALYVLYRLYFAVFTGTSGLLDMGVRALFGFDYLLLAGILVLCVFCFALGGKKPLLYLIPLGITAAAYIWMAVSRVVYFVFVLHPLLMLLITVLLMLNVSGVMKTSMPALFLSLMQAGVGFYTLYGALMGRMVMPSEQIAQILGYGLRCIAPSLLYIGLALFAAAAARKKTV